MRRKSRLLKLLAILFAFTLIAAACGDDDDDGATTGQPDASDDSGSDDSGIWVETSENVLFIHSLDELKTRLAKVILMILIVRFFEVVLAMKFTEPLSLIYLSGGIALIGIGLYFSHKAEK